MNNPPKITRELIAAWTKWEHGNNYTERICNYLVGSNFSCSVCSYHGGAGCSLYINPKFQLSIKETQEYYNCFEKKESHRVLYRTSENLNLI